MSDPATETSENVVEIRGLSRRFGAKTALDDITLTIPAGTVLGLVGRNGAGKTTFIRHVLGLLKAQTGSVRVFGRDPVTDPAGVLSRIGYLSEDADLPAWMRVGELMAYSRAFYPSWDPEYADQLRREFGLEASTPIKNLSKGQRARAGLLVALAYRPELLVLDEPSSGLDPIVRRDILAAIIRTIADEGRTVLFSSHLLSEVERVSDRVAMIEGGRLLFCAPLDDLQGSHWWVTFRFAQPLAAAPALEGVLSWEGSGREWRALYTGPREHLEAQAAVLGAEIVRQASLNLDEIFLARAEAGVAR